MYTCIIHIYIYIYVYVYISLSIYIHIYIYINHSRNVWRIHIYIYIYIYIHVGVLTVYIYIHTEIVYICTSICGPLFLVKCFALSAAIIRTTHRSGYIALAVCAGVEAQEEKPQQQCVQHSYIYIHTCRSSYRMPSAAPPQCQATGCPCVT